GAQQRIAGNRQGKPGQGAAKRAGLGQSQVYCRNAKRSRLQRKGLPGRCLWYERNRRCNYANGQRGVAASFVLGIELREKQAAGLPGNITCNQWCAVCSKAYIGAGKRETRAGQGKRTLAHNV